MVGVLLWNGMMHTAFTKRSSQRGHFRRAARHRIITCLAGPPGGRGATHGSGLAESLETSRLAPVAVGCLTPVMPTP